MSGIVPARPVFRPGVRIKQAIPDMHLQKLVDICVNKFRCLGLQIIIKKSACIRVGNNFRNTDLCIFC